MKKHTSFIAGLCMTALLTGCTTPTQHLSATARSSIHTVSINPTITMPSTIDYAGSHQTTGMMLGCMVAGPLGELAGEGMADASESSTRAKLLKEMQQHGIKLNQMLYQNFSSDLRDQTSFKQTRAANYDAQFKLTINSFGFIDKSQSIGTMPFVNVTGQLIDRQGHVVWQTTKEIDLDNSQFGGNSVMTYLDNPKLMQKAFNALMKQTSDDLISTLMV